MIDFTAAFTILLIGVLVPLINFSIIPIRYGMIQTRIESKIHELAQHGKLSEALELNQLGVDSQDPLCSISGCAVKEEQVHLCISSMRRTDRIVNVTDAKTITPDWLPQGALSPCDYSLVLQTQVDVSPIVTMSVFGANIPGITTPFRCAITKAAEWENIGRDPVTGKFFINE
jgi:hypothetical protein